MGKPTTAGGVSPSLVLGFAALAWALGCEALTGLEVEARQDLHPLLAVVWVPGLQVLAILNIFLALRDARKGKRFQAALGLLASLVAALEPLVLPLLGK